MPSPYSLDLAPSDYYQHLSIVNDFSVEKFVSKEAGENRLSQIFANRGQGFNESATIQFSSKYQQYI